MTLLKPGTIVYSDDKAGQGVMKQIQEKSTKSYDFVAVPDEKGSIFYLFWPLTQSLLSQRLWVYIFWHNYLSIKCGVYQSRWQTKSIGSVRMAEFPSNHSESSWKRWDKYNRIGKLTVEQSWWLPYMQICLILNKSPKIHSYLIYYTHDNLIQ